MTDETPAPGMKDSNLPGIHWNTQSDIRKRMTKRFKDGCTETPCSNILEMILDFETNNPPLRDLVSTRQRSNTGGLRFPLALSRSYNSLNPLVKTAKLQALKNPPKTGLRRQMAQTSAMDWKAGVAEMWKKRQTLG